MCATTSPRRYVIVGAGIAGLAAAYELRRRDPAAAITVIEQDSRIGGKILTEHVNGFTIEAGPESFLSSKPAGIGLCRELGIEDTLEGTIPENRGTYVLRNDKLYPMPEGLTGLVPGRLAPLLRSGLLSPAGRARAALEPVIPRRESGDDETLGSFIRRRFGAEAYTGLIEALMAGIYAGNGDDLSVAATFPHLAVLEREHGSIMRGMRRAPARPASGLPPFLTPVQGMGALVQALRAALPNVTLATGRRARHLTRTGATWTLHLEGDETIPADAIVLATPAYASAALIERVAPDAAIMLSAIPYASTATVSLAYSPGVLIDPLPGYGYIIPRREGKPVLACTWVSAKLRHRAPPGYALLRLFVGRAGNDAAVMSSDAALIALAREELRGTMGITADPVLARVFRWPGAMPQYTPGHVERVARVDKQIFELPGLAVAGSAYRGVGIPDCIASGRDAAVHLVEAAVER